MGFFGSLFARNKKPTLLAQAVVASRVEAVSAAEQKLGRRLTSAEQRGIERISSLMMLESCVRSFSSPVSTPADVLADLAHFAKAASVRINATK